ncbi:MAG: hypothetical protein ACD_87C00123G0002 [uncultured bacterium]|nr:MAG: hypothetical protein ACD_87C00123G0002 [uncultured bacterium]
MNEIKKPTEEMIDYLAEMMNIGAGHSARALSQLLQCKVEMSMPVIHILPSAEKLPAILTDAVEQMICVRMEMLGDVTGHIDFALTHRHQAALMKFLKTAIPKEVTRIARLDTTIIEEIANIVAGAFLTALHDFAGVNICHTVPIMSLEFPSILGGGSPSPASDTRMLVIECEFQIEQAEMTTILFLIPSPASVARLFSSIDAARAGMSAE